MGVLERVRRIFSSDRQLFAEKYGHEPDLSDPEDARAYVDFVEERRGEGAYKADTAANAAYHRLMDSDRDDPETYRAALEIAAEKMGHSPTYETLQRSAAARLHDVTDDVDEQRRLEEEYNL